MARLFLLIQALLCLHGYSMACGGNDDVIEQNDISIINILDDNGDWETVVKNHLDPNVSPNNTNVDVKRQLVDQDGKLKMVVTVSLKGNVKQFGWSPLRFYSPGAKNIVVFHGGTAVQKMNAMEDEGYGGVLTTRPLQDNELFQVRIDKMIDKFSTSIGIGISKLSPRNTEYGSWMMCSTKMLYNNQLYENGSVTKKEYGPNLRKLKVGDRLGVMKMANGNLHFFVNGMDLGIAASGVGSRVYGVLDLYGNVVEASLA